MRYRKGVIDVVNRITIKPTASATHVKERVEAALTRRGTSDAKSIHVETADGTVTLTGNACHWQSVEHAANAAWAVPGVTEVVINVQITPSS